MTNFERMTESPAAMAKNLQEWADFDISTLWCNDKRCAAINGEWDEGFDCTNEMFAACITRWLMEESLNDAK